MHNMLNKLAFRNAIRSLNDFLLYFITMVLVTALMFSFNSLLFSKSIQILWKGGGFYAAMLILVTVFIVFIIVWLVHYMVRFMAEKRSREFGTYLLLGFQKAQIARLFLHENLLIGIVAFFVGIFPGLFLQQLLMKLLYVMIDESYFVRFDLNSNTFIMTAAVYCFSYLLALVSNRQQLKKMNIAAMMQQERKNDELSNTNKPGTIALFFTGILYLLFFALSTVTLELNIGIVLLLILGLVISIYFIYAGVSGFLICFIKKGNSFVWKDGNIFVLRQLSSKIRTMRFTLGTLTLLFMIALVGGSCAMMLNAFQSTQAEEKWPFDISLFSLDTKDNFGEELSLIENVTESNNHYIYHIYQDEASVMTDYLLENVSDVNEYSYFPKDTFMKISDYNTLREMLGYKPVTLEQGEYLIHIKARMRQYAEEFANTRPLIIDNQQLFCGGIFTEGFGQNRHNGADYLFIVEDQLITAMQPYYSVLAANIKGDISEQTYNMLNELQIKKPMADDRLNSYGTGTDHIAVNISNVYVKSLDTLWMKSTLSAAIFPLIYIGLVCISVALTILSVQQLSDAEKQKRNYAVLKKVGMDASVLSSVILKQTAVYFLFPYLVAVVISIGIDNFISKNFAVFSGVLFPHWIYFGISLTIFSGIYLLYYVVTYVQLKLQFTASSGRHSVLERPFSEANGRPFFS